MNQETIITKAQMEGTMKIFSKLFSLLLILSGLTGITINTLLSKDFAAVINLYSYYTIQSNIMAVVLLFINSNFALN